MRKALIVGINDYPGSHLDGCENDAIEISRLLQKHDDGSRNFDIKTDLSIQTKGELKGKIKALFSGGNDIELLYFSGHGHCDKTGGYLVTPDYAINDWGVSMKDILKMANDSSSTNRIVIFDCCYSGSMGTSPINQSISEIGKGVTILTSSRDTEISEEIDGHGVFTALLLEALKGGAANILGDITPGSIYAYIDQSLGTWHQRPIFKTNISKFVSLRKAKSRVSFDDLKMLLKCFDNENSVFSLDPSFEFTNKPDYENKTIKPYADDDNVNTFKVLQRLESVDIVEPVKEEHMYFAAMKSGGCRLTPIGKYYWKLLVNNRI
ncbi:caspase family protein [Ruminococcus sp. NK3A76]|uniref:caspase family protein n=1 Tax=Ruminococcus sp. NK3A76 TaxID=877411 RepID=UPI00049089EB|nr:caspase family protein [Ruminococcus sp. NK3A76]